MIRPFLASATLAVVLLAGCHSGQNSATQSSANTGVQVYHLRGTVVSVAPSSGIVEVNGEKIPGFMEAMTMPYQLKNPALASKLHPGDRITADLMVSKTSTQTVALDNVDVISQARPQVRGHVSPAGR